MSAQAIMVDRQLKEPKFDHSIQELNTYHKFSCGLTYAFRLNVYMYKQFIPIYYLTVDLAQSFTCQYAIFLII